jgi:hypothetical protein
LFTLTSILSTFNRAIYLPSYCDIEEVLARQDEREIKTEHGIIIPLHILSRNKDEDYLATPIPLPRKGFVPKEGEPKQGKGGVETAKLQALKKFGDSLEKVISSHDISDEGKVEIINKTTSHAVDIFDARQKGVSFEQSLQQKAQTLQKKEVIFSHQPKQEKAVQPPDLSEIPLWRGRREDGMPLEFIKIHYGQYLSAFGAEQNSVFQDQIRAHDPKLLQGVINQFREEGKGRKVGDFVKTRSARVDRELKSIDPEYLREAHREVHRLKVAARRRDPKS